MLGEGLDFVLLVVCDVLKKGFVFVCVYVWLRLWCVLFVVMVNVYFVFFKLLSNCLMLWNKGYGVVLWVINVFL